MSPHLHQHVAQARIDDMARAAARHHSASALRSPREPRVRIAGLFRKPIIALDTMSLAPIARRFAR